MNAVIAKKITVMSLSVMILLTSVGCSVSSFRTDQLLAKMTPRAYRDQIFSNTPTGYNQNDFESEEEANMTKAQLLREMRNGNRRYDEKYRMAGVRKDNDMPDGSTEDSYGAGFAMGCDTSMSILGASLYRTNYPDIDAERMMHDQWHLRGYQDGAKFCKDRTDWELH